MLFFDYIYIHAISIRLIIGIDKILDTIAFHHVKRNDSCTSRFTLPPPRLNRHIDFSILFAQVNTLLRIVFQFIKKSLKISVKTTVTLCQGFYTT